MDMLCILQKEQKDRHIENGWWFPVMYFLLAGLSFNSLTAGRPWMKWLIAGTAICGGALLLWRLLHWKEYRRMPGLLLWILFFSSYALSSLLNASYGIRENLEAMVWLGLQLFVLYPHRQDDVEKGWKAEERFSMVIVLYTTVQALVSLAMLSVGYGGVDSERGMYIGLQLGRLWGSYSDPNYGAILSCVSILCSFWLIRRNGKKKVLLFAHIGLQYLYIIFSYSRSGQVCLAASVGITFLCYWPQISGGIKRKLLLLALVAVIVGPACGWIRDGYNQLHLTVYAAEYQEKKDGLHREDELEEDITNGRLATWKDGLEVWKANPIFGISYRNIAPYMQENFPDASMVNREYHLNTFHNMLIDVAVSQGSVGLILVLAAVCFLFRRFISMFSQWKDEDFLLRIIPALIVITIGIGSMFVSDIFYINTPTSVAFWFFLGRFWWRKRDFFSDRGCNV